MARIRHHNVAHPSATNVPFLVALLVGALGTFGCSAQNAEEVAETEAAATGSSCGDGVVNGSEQCDDGNLMSGDGCSSTCLREARCGDGVVNGTEQCDDGNLMSGDGCSSTCLREARCGDGVVAGSEQCDDGNLMSGDGCSSTCLREARCGDGVVNGTEQCDDGNLMSGDGCSSTCLREARCGDGVVAGTEQCDDGNLMSGDGCSSTCLREPACNDRIKNGTETDVDCGGSCGTKCAVGKACVQAGDCSSNLCASGICSTSTSCTPATATDLGAPGVVSAVGKSACLRVQNGYPSWWGTARVMQFQTQSSGSYPVPFTWSNACTGTSGTDTFTANWQTRTLGRTTSKCATLIKLNGSGSGTIRVTYYGQ